MVKNSVVKRKKNIPKTLLILSISVFSIIFIVFAIRIIYNKTVTEPDSIKFNELWEAQKYDEVYGLSQIILEETPFKPIALMYQGYAAFYLANSQTESLKAQELIDVSINSLRIAREKAFKNVVPQIDYMLGKAYFHKDDICSYTYYADLAVKYLNLALSNGYIVNDIYEYLGLAYADLEMTSDSIAAFTEALQYNDTDVLLMAIAEQYHKNNQNSSAKQYLYRIKKTSTDDELVLKCSNELGVIYFEDGDFEAAMKEFLSILEKDPNYADAHYGIGLIYEKKGDNAKARAEWRKALYSEPNHTAALQKMED